MIKLVIFDLDGTLLDTLEDIANACNHALKKCGHPTRELKEYNMFVGRGIDNLFRGALPAEHKNEDMVKEMRNLFVPYYNRHKCDFTKPYTGIIETLQYLSKKGVKFAVTSNKYQEGTEQLVEKYFGEFHFTKILGQREGKPIKPDPQIVFEAMEGTEGLVPDEVLYCGDSDVDMQTGINAGVRTVGVTWGFRTREELEAHSPFAVIDNPEEIIDIIQNL